MKNFNEILLRVCLEQNPDLVLLANKLAMNMVKAPTTTVMEIRTKDHPQYQLLDVKQGYIHIETTVFEFDPYKKENCLTNYGWCKHRTVWDCKPTELVWKEIVKLEDLEAECQLNSFESQSSKC